MNNKIAVTRPIESGVMIVKELCSIHGFDNGNFILSPMIEIEHLDVSLPCCDAYDGLIITSAHALDAVNSSHLLNIPIYIIGQGSADKYRKIGGLGDINVFNNAIDLSHFIQNIKGSRLLYLSGRDVSYDLQAVNSGIEKIVVYNANKIEKIDNSFYDTLEKGQIKAITFFSKRSAEILISHVGGRADLDGVCFLCLSERIGDYLASVRANKIYVAKQANRQGMIDLIVRFGVT